MIYYLAHPWSNDPITSFNQAVKWTMILRENDHIVFSPILHTHPYWKMLGGIAYPKGKVHVEAPERESYLNYEDWLTWDLGIMAELKEPIVLMSKTAYIMEYDGEKPLGILSWLSTGCHKEYTYAKTHNIPVLELEAFLEGVEVVL